MGRSAIQELKNLDIPGLKNLGILELKNLDIPELKSPEFVQYSVVDSEFA